MAAPEKLSRRKFSFLSSLAILIAPLMSVGERLGRGFWDGSQARLDRLKEISRHVAAAPIVMLRGQYGRYIWHLGNVSLLTFFSCHMRGYRTDFVGMSKN